VITEQIKELKSVPATMTDVRRAAGL
jgi:hypothetical protein